MGYKRGALVYNAGANSTTLDRWDMVTARVCYVSLMVILHITVQVLRDGAYSFPSSSEKTIKFNKFQNQSEGSAFSSVISIATLRVVRPRTRAYLALVAQKVDSAVHRINYYPVVSAAIGFQNNYPVDSDLSRG